MIALLLSQWSYGYNKVDYKNLKWGYLDGKHFNVYFYQGGERLAEFALAVLEEAYEEYKDYFPGAVGKKEKIPVLIYVSPKDFQMTNVSPYLIPEGVGGFTEGFKRRIVVPFAGSYAEFRHVLRHELVHAFQYSYSRGLSSMFSSPPPLWFVEGMAEFLSEGWSVRTEAYMRDMVINLTLPPLSEMDYYSGYVVYRYGEAFFNYIKDIYGREAVRDFIRYGMGGNIRSALKRITHKDLPEIDEEFSMYIKERVLKAMGRFNFPDDIKKLTSRRRDHSFLNLGTAISPDGSKVAFMSDRGGRIGIYVIDLATRKVHKLLTAGRSPDFENLHILKPSLSISKDNRLVTISQGTYSDILHIYDLNTFKRVRKVPLDFLDGAHGARISPNGSKVVFVGYVNGRTDLYIYDVEGDSFRKITDDEWSEDDPYWWDDSTVIYVSDRNDLGQIGSYSIYRMTLGGEPEYVWGRRKILRSPIRWKDGVAFLTDYDGAVNLFLLRGDSILMLTDYFTEIAHPDVSENGRLAFSMMWEGGWDVFLAPYSVDPKYAVNLMEEEGYPKPDSTVLAGVVKRPLGFTLGLDMAFANLGYSSFYGTVGTFYMLFSDIPGDNWIFLEILGQSQNIDNSEFVFVWYNFKGRLDKVVGFSQLWNFKYLTPYFVFEKRLSGELGFQYPFTRYFRSEGYLSAHYNTWIRFHEDSLPYYCVFQAVPTPGCKVPEVVYPKGYDVALSLVYDDVLLTNYGSTDGVRWRLVGATSLPNSQVDFRTLFFEGMLFRRITYRSIWANRLVLARSVGRHRDAFTAGGPYGLRAYDLFYFFYDESGKPVRYLIGNNLALLNSEIRFPFLDRLKFGFLPFEIRGIRALAFFDIGNAWFDEDIPLDKFQPIRDGALWDLFADVGVGLRLNLGYFPLRLDYAYPTDFRRLYPARWVISFGWDF
ncbi:MAG: BamA/TamA family outer membrane protein [Thermotogae bacterium]|nr:BamA/TamA family outer membrane protein [Thermotogota bacterium]